MRSWASSYCSARTRIFQSPRPPWFFCPRSQEGRALAPPWKSENIFCCSHITFKKSIDVNKPQLEVFTKLKYRIVIIYIIIAFLRVNCETLNGKFWRSNPYSYWTSCLQIIMLKSTLYYQFMISFTFYKLWYNLF